jgi:hypothetical protein
VPIARVPAEPADVTSKAVARTARAAAAFPTCFL